jgi:hypothetical protein
VSECPHATQAGSNFRHRTTSADTLHFAAATGSPARRPCTTPAQQSVRLTGRPGASALQHGIPGVDHPPSKRLSGSRSPGRRAGSNRFPSLGPAPTRRSPPLATMREAQVLADVSSFTDVTATQATLNVIAGVDSDATTEVLSPSSSPAYTPRGLDAETGSPRNLPSQTEDSFTLHKGRIARQLFSSTRYLRLALRPRPHQLVALLRARPVRAGDSNRLARHLH